MDLSTTRLFRRSWTRPRRGSLPAACVLGLALGLTLAAGCESETEQAQDQPEKVGDSRDPQSWTHFAIPAKPEFTATTVSTGKAVYEANCAGCHGDTGAGDGTCAAFLLPHPRDFTTATFRFKTTPGGELPTEEDLFRTISVGLHGTGMPPWRFLLSDEDRWALVSYIKTFAPAFETTGAGSPVDLGAEPQATAEAIARGRDVFVKAECGQCHGERGYGDGPSVPGMRDSFDQPISPRNFHKAPEFKRGHTRRDIALTIHTGNNGTPMPAYEGVLAPEEIWDLAAYVQSLSEAHLAGGGSPAAATRGEDLGAPDVVVKLTERKWKFTPDVIKAKVGQVVRVEFQPTDNGLGVGHGFAIDGYDKSTFINGAMVQRPKSVTFRADKAGTFTFYCATQCSTGPLHPHMNGKFVVEPN
jgi:mono/diheme cytochrome c family protein